MDYRLKGRNCREVEGEGHFSSKRKKECRAADPSRGKGRDLGEDRGAGLGHRVERADMSMHRLQSTPVSQAKQGCKRVCMCVCVCWGPVKAYLLPAKCE